MLTESVKILSVDGNGVYKFLVGDTDNVSIPLYAVRYIPIPFFGTYSGAPVGAFNGKNIWSVETVFIGLTSVRK